MSKIDVTIKDIIQPSNEVYVIKHDTTGGKLRNMFADTPLEDVLVVDSKNRCLGIIPVNAIFNRFSETQPAKNIVKKVSLLRSNADLIDAAMKMVGNNATILPVVSKDETLEGLLIDYDLADYFLRNIQIGGISIEEIIEDTPFTLTDSDNLGRVLQIYREGKITEIPVIDHQELVFKGSVSINAVCRDWSNQSTIIWLDDKKRDVKHLMDAAVIKEDIVTLYLEKKPSLEQAFNLMKKTQVRTLFVIDTEGKYRGLVTLRGIIRSALEWMQEQTIPSVSIQVSNAPDDEVREFTLRKAQAILNRFIESLGNEAEVNVKFFKSKKESQKGVYLWSCNVRFVGGKGRANIKESSATEFGCRKAANLALEKMNRILSDISQETKERVKKDHNRPLEDIEAEETKMTSTAAKKAAQKAKKEREDIQSSEEKEL